MGKNHSDKPGSKQTTTGGKSHPLSPTGQKEPDRPQHNRMRTIKPRLGFFGYDKETKEYTPDGHLAKITKEYQPGKTLWDWLNLLGTLATPLVVVGATRKHIAENHPNKKESKLPATEDKPQPLSPTDQKGTDRPQNNQLEDIGNQSRDRDHKVTEEYSAGTPVQPSEVIVEQKRDWWQLLIIPLLLLVLGLAFPGLQFLANRQLADDQQKETILKTYLDDMSDLLLNPNHKPDLRTSQPTDEIRQVAKERTLTTLRRLDADRNRIVLRFLRGAGLIGIQKAVIDLSNADLSHDDLSGTNLSGIDLSSDDLSHANLSDANLNGTILNSATLSKAIMNSTILSNTFLNGAILIGADLSDASVDGADLRYANLSDAIMKGTSLNGAIMKGVDLSNAFLNNAILIGAILIDADLSNADLSNASVSNAILSDAILSSADLKGADLSNDSLNGVLNLTQQQLDEVYSCTNATLSPGLTCHRNQ